MMVPAIPREWRFGMVLEHRDGDRVLFIRFDKDRDRMFGGGKRCFIGMRLGSGRRAVNTKVGVLGNYTIGGWTVKDDVIAIPTTMPVLATTRAEERAALQRQLHEMSMPAIKSLVEELVDAAKAPSAISGIKTGRTWR